MAERIVILTDRVRGRIAREVYGHFIEHLGRCIYDGIWVGDESKIPNVDGIRKEAIDVFRAVEAPLIRWPGGYFADCYDWHDGIGPREKRPIRFHEFEPNGEEPNAFGTHEFLRFCELTGAEPFICVNTATMTAQDAMNWVEYCNYGGQTSYAQLRRRNGRDKAWRVRHWAIGNESYWLHRAQDYVQRFLLWRKYMRRIDPEITCIASLLEPTWHPEPFGPLDDWLQDVIGGIRGHMDMASLHLYSGCGSGDEFTEAEYWGSLAQIEQRNRLRIESLLGAVDSIVGKQVVKLALDEWGLWHPGAKMDNNCEQPCTQRDALFAARYFHLLQRYPDRIGLATIAQSVNVLHALLKTDGPRTYRTPTFHVFEMFRGHQGSYALPLLHSSPRVEVVDKDVIMTGDSHLDVLTCSASISGDRKEVLLTVTNADIVETYSCEVELRGLFNAVGASCRTLAAAPWAHNTFEDTARVRPKEDPIMVCDNRFAIELPPSSVLAVTVRGS
jgi:alpha-N-arabinofuranosidase